MERVQFVRYLPDRTVVKSGWGYWKQSEIDGIMEIHRQAGRDVIVESEFPEFILDDILDADVIG